VSNRFSIILEDLEYIETKTTVVKLKGGTGSGHHGHQGRPGKVGGSLPGSGILWSDLSKMSDDDKFALINASPVAAVHMNRKAYDANKKAYGNKAWNMWIARNVLHDEEAEAAAQEISDKMKVKSARLPVTEQDPRILSLMNKHGDPDHMSDSRLLAINKEITATISERSGISEQAVADVLGKMNASTNPKMVAAIQKASVSEFSAKLSTYQKRAYADVNVGDVTQERKILRAVYDETQHQLAIAGYKPNDTITLYRGFVDGKKRQLGSDVGYKGNAVESWTTEFNIAQHFSTGASFNDDESVMGIGYIFSASVRIGDILSVATTGPGVINEGEVLVFGSNVNTVKIHGTEPVGT
jgi:hypothetical protein